MQPAARTYLRATFHMRDGATEEHDVFFDEGGWHVRGSSDPGWQADRVVLTDGTVIKDRDGTSAR